MRIGPVGFLSVSEEDVIRHAYLATVPSHNSKEAIRSARMVALIIYYIRCGLSKKDIIGKFNLNVRYEPFVKFNVTCKETLGNVLYAFFNSNGFEEAIKSIISFGGDTDTNAAIVGSMAEAMYGIPNDLISQAREKIPREFSELLDKG